MAEGSIAATLAKKVLTSVGEGAAGEVGGWIMGKVLAAIFGGDDTQEILDDLKEIKDNQTEILKDLKYLTTEIAWAKLEEEKFRAVTVIQNLFEDFLKIPTLSTEDAQIEKAKELVAGVMDPDNGVELALTQIHDLMCGTDELVTDQGMIDLAMSTALDRVAGDPGGSYLIDEFKAMQTFFGAAFNLQYQGTLLLYNCYVHMDQAELAQDALTTLAKRLSTQAKTVHDATPRAMNFVAHLHETNAPVRVRISPKLHPKLALKYESVGLHSEEAQLILAEHDDSDWFDFEMRASDVTYRRFLFHPIPNSANDVIYISRPQYDKHADTEGTLQWWAGVSQKNSIRAFAFVHSTKDPTQMMVSLNGKDAWTYEDAKTKGLHKHPALLTNGPLQDDPVCYILIEPMDAPQMLP